VFGLGIALTLGLLLAGLVTFQASVLPRPGAALLLSAMAGFAFVFFVAEVLPPAAGQRCEARGYGEVAYRLTPALRVVSVAGDSDT
jgi:hypothetical protein